LKELRLSMKGILVLVELFFEKISKTLAKRDHVVIRGLCSSHV
jgi:nucleoid DNA-binding protein